MRGSSVTRRTSSTGVWIGFDKPRTIISNGFAGELAVPMWARFMKVATAKDKPDTFKAPQGVMPVNVCRLSGQLPGAAAIVSSPNTSCAGQRRLRSARNTIFFASSTQIAAVASGRSGSAAATAIDWPAARVGRLPPSRQRRAELVMASRPAETAEQPKKKRGFWGRLFGRDKRQGRNRSEGRRSQK